MLKELDKRKKALRWFQPDGDSWSLCDPFSHPSLTFDCSDPLLIALIRRALPELYS